MTMGRVLLFLPVLESERMEPSTPSQPALGAFVYVEGGKLYYEECGIGPEAVILIHNDCASPESRARLE